MKTMQENEEPVNNRYFVFGNDQNTLVQFEHTSAVTSLPIKLSDKFPHINTSKIEMYDQGIKNLALSFEDTLGGKEAKLSSASHAVRTNRTGPTHLRFRDTKSYVLDENDVQTIANLAKKVAAQPSQYVLPAVPPVFIEKRLSLGLTSIEVGVMLVIMFGTLLVATFLFKVQFVHPVVGVTCLIAGGTYLLMGVANKQNARQ